MIGTAPAPAPANTKNNWNTQIINNALHSNNAVTPIITGNTQKSIIF